MRRIAPALAVAALLGAAADDPLAGRVPGAAADCVPLRSNSALTIWDGKTVAYRENGRRTWISHPVGHCVQMHGDDTLIYDVFGGRLCRNDRFRVLTRGSSIASATCRLGPFIPSDKPEQTK